MNRAALVTVILAVLAPSPAWAGRPLETEDTATLAPGTFESEMSGDYVRNPDDDSWSVKGVLKAGTWPRFEAKLELPVLVLEPDRSRSHSGVGDAVVGAKYRFVDEEPAVPALLGAVALRLPTGDTDRSLGREDVDVTAVGVVGKTFGSFIVHGNIGYTFVTANRDLDVWTLAASAEYRVTAALSLVGEVLGFLASHCDERATGRVRAGATYAIRRNVRLDAAVGHGFTRGSPRALVTVGVTVPF
jgi:outer membrane putative beta-barrel porin/alpha-amylase